MNKFLKELIEWIKVIIVALILAFVIQIFVSPTIVRGQSMYPTLDNNNYLLINKMAYFSKIPQRGDIVVFKSDLKSEDGKNKDLVKRVIGIPGDEVEVTDGKVYVNGNELKENYILDDYTDGEVKVIVPENEVFVMGDNRGNSLDSRSEQVGFIEIKKDIVGKVFIRLFPFDNIRKF